MNKNSGICFAMLFLLLLACTTNPNDGAIAGASIASTNSEIARRSPRPKGTRNSVANATTLPGSVKAVEEYMGEILKTLEHLVRMLHAIDTH